MIVKFRPMQAEDKEPFKSLRWNGSNIMPTVRDDTAFTHAILSDKLKQAFYSPNAEDAAKAKALINFLMEDRLFLGLYRSNDPKVRVVAMDKLNKAHHQAYGDAPTKHDDAGSVE
jgi:hypothetical protein